MRKNAVPLQYQTTKHKPNKKLKTTKDMMTEKIYKTFAAFCKGENLIKGNVKSHCDGFTYCECKDRLTHKKVIIYFDNDDNCVYYY